MQKHSFSFELGDRINNMEKFLELLQEERTAIINILARTRTFISEEEDLKIIDLRKKLISLEQEIASKMDFVDKLKNKKVLDEKEIQKNINEAKGKYKALVKKTEEYLDNEEEEKGRLSAKGNIMNFQMNNIIIAVDEKNDGALAYWYNALDREMSSIPKLTLKVNND